MKRILFYADSKDITPTLADFEAREPLKFVLMGNLDYANRPIYLKSVDIPNPGVSTHETGLASTAYMISLRDKKNDMHKFQGQSGETRWVLNNSDNPDAVVLTMGGEWQGNAIVQGSIDTISQNPVAQRLMKVFLAALKAHGFIKVEHWWIGGSAMRRARAGTRLTQSAQSPERYDLKLPA